MPTQLFTNREGNTLLKKFEGSFTHVPNIQHFDVLVGYFRASGYFQLRKFLDEIPKIRIQVGINVDALTKAFHDRGQQYLADTKVTKDEFLAEMVQNIQDANYDKATEDGILQFIGDLISEKIG